MLSPEGFDLLTIVGGNIAGRHIARWRELDQAQPVRTQGDFFPNGPYHLARDGKTREGERARSAMTLEENLSRSNCQNRMDVRDPSIAQPDGAIFVRTNRICTYFQGVGHLRAIAEMDDEAQPVKIRCHQTSSQNQGFQIVYPKATRGGTGGVCP